jgi:four helix bundle protein
MTVARRFEDLIVWQLAVRIRDRVYALTEAGAASRDFKFRDQIRDSASSVPSNISEGFLLYSPPQFARLLNIAKGSLGETQNHLLHGKEKKYFSEEEFTDLWRLTCRAVRATNRLHAYLRRCGRRQTPLDVKPGTERQNLAEPNPVAPNPVEPNPVEPNPAEPNPVEPNLVEPNPVEPNPVEPNPVEPNPVEPNPVEPNPVEPRRTT